MRKSGYFGISLTELGSNPPSSFLFKKVRFDRLGASVELLDMGIHTTSNIKNVHLF